MKEQLTLAIKLQKGEIRTIKTTSLVCLYPNDSEIYLHCRLVHDSMGLEKEAVEFCEKAVRLGLKEENLKDAFVCLGSTYRVLGNYYEKSLEVLTEVRKLFPDYRPVQIFLSLTLYSLKRYSEAMEIVLKNLIDTTDDEGLHNYQRALEYYADHLRVIKGMYFYLCIVDESMFLDSEEGYWLYKEEGIRYKNSKKALKKRNTCYF